jgi:hypothetical protein
MKIKSDSEKLRRLGRLVNVQGCAQAENPVTHVRRRESA